MLERFLDKIIPGDALTLLRELPDESIDAVVTDPPYSSGGQFRGDRMAPPSEKYQNTGTERSYPEFHGDTRDQRGYGYWSALWLSECWRVAKPGAPICVFTDWRQLPITTDAVQAGGWTWLGVVPWDKTEGARPQRGRFRAQCEYIVWGAKGQLWSDGEGPCLPGCFRVVVRQADKFHVTGKPTDLMRAVLQICPPGGIVLDPFAGSGTTGVAARELGMSFIGFDRTPAYVPIAAERIANARDPLFPFEATS